MTDSTRWLWMAGLFLLGWLLYLLHPILSPFLIGILLAYLGDPLVDFAYHCMTWHMHNGPTSRGLAGQDLAALGIPDEAAYLQAYLRSTGALVGAAAGAEPPPPP